MSLKQQPLMDAIGDPQARRAFDYYPTPAWMTRALIRRVQPFDVLEPCSGAGAISDIFKAAGTLTLTNDLDQSRPSQLHMDATDPKVWAHFATYRPMWGVTNLPFDVADVIVPLAVASLPHFATILRLSWLEPTAARARFLSQHPPAKLIVMPRHDFKGRGATDSVTSAWFCWEQGISFRAPAIEVVTRDERDELIALHGKA